MKVAILIPTLNRRDFVERTVSYYNSLNSPHPIYLGDASDQDYAAQTANMLKRFNNVEVKYFHWQGLDDPRTLIKLAETASRDFQFCVTTGDDDFLIPSSLTRCAQFLAENREYRTAQGRSAIFDLDRSGAYGNIRRLCPWWGINCIEQETGLERLQYFQKKYYGTQFSVHRTEEFLQDCKYFMQIKDGYIGEWFHCFTFAIRGKSKFVDCLYLIRNVHDGRREINNLSLIMRPNFSMDLETCINGLSLSLHEIDGMPLNRAREIVTGVMMEYLNSGVFGIDQAAGKVSFLSLVKRFLPAGFKSILQKLRVLTVAADDMRLLRSKRSLFYKDFEPVINSLSKRPS